MEGTAPAPGCTWTWPSRLPQGPEAEGVGHGHPHPVSSQPHGPHAVPFSVAQTSSFQPHLVESGRQERGRGGCLFMPVFARRAPQAPSLARGAGRKPAHRGALALGCWARKPSTERLAPGCWEEAVSQGSAWRRGAGRKPLHGERLAVVTETSVQPGRQEKLGRPGWVGCLGSDASRVVQAVCLLVRQLSKA